MDMKEEMMSDAVDDVMDGEGEEEEEVEGDRILKEVLDEIGISVGQQVSLHFSPLLFCLFFERGPRTATARLTILPA